MNRFSTFYFLSAGFLRFIFCYGAARTLNDEGCRSVQQNIDCKYNCKYLYAAITSSNPAILIANFIRCEIKALAIIIDYNCQRPGKKCPGLRSPHRYVRIPIQVPGKPKFTVVIL